MKANLNNLDTEQFRVNSGEVGGELCFLVQPTHIATKWTKDNLIFRSSIWNREGEPVSLSFKKFFNWNERPEIYPAPASFKKSVNVIEKIDGSTLILSNYKGEQIHRTRGTFDATKAENGFEIELFKNKYPELFKFSKSNPTFSILTEWTTPTNQIVIKYPEPELYLIGIVDHKDYSLIVQSHLDDIAENLALRRPRRFDFSSVEEMMEAVEAFQGMEGICGYYNNDQNIRKDKGAQYLALHRFRSGATEENIVDMFQEFGYPNYIEFQNKIIDKFDYECFDYVRNLVSRVCDAYKEVENIINGMRKFVVGLNGMSRKDAAMLITSSYGVTNRAGYAFQILDGKSIDKNGIKKLFLQILKSS